MAAIYDDYRMCYGKRPYSYDTANKVVQRRKAEDDIDLRVYHCPVCQKYHISKVPENEERRP